MKDNILGKIAVKQIEPEEQELTTLKECLTFKIYCASFVDGGALAQMETATKLLIAVVGALNFDELLEKKCKISEMMLQDIQREGDMLGLTIFAMWC